jgi:hypothetical protein
MSRHVRTLLLVAVVATAWAVSHVAAPGLDAAWLSALPALALVAFLLDGQYVGERAIDAARRGRRAPDAPRFRVVGSAPPARRRAASRHRPGGLLLARRLAGRAPPRALAA